MKLYDLMKSLTQVDFEDCEVSCITDDSRNIKEGCVFVCVKGASFDGHSAAAKASEAKAAAIITQRDMGVERQIIVEDTRKFYGMLCAAWFSHPEKKMKFVGVTGTNGKTTMTNVIKYILTQNGHKVGLIGTIRNEIGDDVIHTDNTTPMAFDYMQLLDRMYKAGCDTVVMEVSSFGLVQQRIGPTHFDVAVFTNLTQDHLDYHKTMENYYQAKKMLFDITDKAICNLDDEYGKRLYSEITCEKYGFSCNKKADFYADVMKLRASQTTFWFCADNKCHNISMNMIGMFNVENVTAAIAACTLMDIPIENIIPAIAKYNGVKGRCEIIPTGRDFTVICDYAHTPDAIENILSSVKEYCEGRLICLFGCGGNRDSAKRPLMAQAAAKFADVLMVTSDNPRNEEPDDIIRDIMQGLTDCKKKIFVEPDRRQAIYDTLKMAQPSDIIVLAGKGHEDYQILKNNVHIHFDEREVVSDGLKLL
ncbi:MAG: UDP-N-acetylmuramoyl-L-alanyl-D-glutamate--2,6-diaminopimelate ligase [Oscillospiraceae bacterium]|nr:UDP-N-acetylmuramoyl-L-alanyl-D-glutamate--2,6-diaminopimelate ligase [Oscillospiraceae bacterium]